MIFAQNSCTQDGVLRSIRSRLPAFVVVRDGEGDQLGKKPGSSEVQHACVGAYLPSPSFAASPGPRCCDHLHHS